MSIKATYNFKLKEANDNILTFILDDNNYEFKVLVLEEDIIRVMLIKNGILKLKNTWTIAPGLEDVPYEGRDKFDISVYSLPNYKYKHNENNNTFEIATSKIKLIIDLNGFKISWYLFDNNKWVNVANDRKTQAYNFGYWGKKLYHYLERNLDEQYYGFGEKSGNLDKHGRRMRMASIDAMGYDAEYSDPLYKHVPFYITRNKKTGLSFGIYYDNMSTCVFEMGSELDNYHGLYRYFEANDGDLDYYFIAGNKVSNVTERFSWLTGKTIFPPKWSLGFSMTTMAYNTQDSLYGFLDECKRHDITCGSLQLPSGYTLRDGKRYMFVWNRENFYDIKAFTKRFKDNGIKLCANIKPCILKEHPMFDELKQKRILIMQENSKEPEMIQFWDDTGAYIDFTNIDGYNWWKEKVKEALLENGIESAWNDNNEYEIWDDNVKVNGFGKCLSIDLVKPLMSMLMMKSSLEAQREFAPDLRPYSVSRSGPTGIQRYVQTWSGDNRTSWNNLKYNIKMGLGYSLSGMYNIGHDVGGFSGNAPSPELLVRWFQNGIFHPRFLTNSWNDDKTVNLPWMYKEVFGDIKKAMDFRVKIIPYMYDLLYKAHTEYKPIIRPMFYDFEFDENTFEESDNFMLGDYMLVASVVEEKARKRKVYLPKSSNWYYYHTDEIYQGGKEVEVSAELEEFPLFIKEGSIIPVNLQNPCFDIKEDIRSFLVYPAINDMETNYRHFGDDGHSFNYLSENGRLFIDLKLKTVNGNIFIFFEKQGKYKTNYNEISFILPKCEKRKLFIEDKEYNLDNDKKITISI